MGLQLWIGLWALASALGGLVAYGNGDFRYTFVIFLYLLGVLAAARTGRVAIAVVAAPLLSLTSIYYPIIPWPLAVLLGLQVVSGSTNLGALLLCLATYAALVQQWVPIAAGSLLLLGNAILLGYLRSRGRLEPILASVQNVCWGGLKVLLGVILICIVIGACVGSGGTGIIPAWFIGRALWASSKKKAA